MSSRNHQNAKLSGQANTEEKYAFDELARGWASGTISRGQALKLAGAAFLGGLLSTTFPGIAQARKRRRHKHHPKHPPNPSSPFQADFCSNPFSGCNFSTCGTPPQNGCQQGSICRTTACTDTNLDNSIPVCWPVEDTSFPSTTGICSGSIDTVSNFCTDTTTYPLCTTTSQCPSGRFCANSSSCCGDNQGRCLKSCSQP